MFFQHGVVYAHWQWIHLRKTQRVFPEITLSVKIILVWSQLRVGSGLLIGGKIARVDLEFLLNLLESVILARVTLSCSFNFQLINNNKFDLCKCKCKMFNLLEIIPIDLILL